MCKLHKLGNLFALEGWPVVLCCAVKAMKVLPLQTPADQHSYDRTGYRSRPHCVTMFVLVFVHEQPYSAKIHHIQLCQGKETCRAWGHYTALTLSQTKWILGIKHGSVSAPRFQENWHTAVKISADRLLWYNKSRRWTTNSKIAFDGEKNVVNCSYD